MVNGDLNLATEVYKTGQVALEAVAAHFGLCKDFFEDHVRSILGADFERVQSGLWDVSAEGWVVRYVLDAEERQAKALRKLRDQRYANIFMEAKTDERWVGDLGEIIFHKWCLSRGLAADWLEEKPVHAPDVVIANRVRVGAKCVKRKVAPQLSYTAQITAKHADEPVDYFFFMSYEHLRRKLWLLGAMDKHLFLEQARYYRQGEFVHPNYQIRPGHEIFNIEISRLVKPSVWVASLAN